MLWERLFPESVYCCCGNRIYELHSFSDVDDANKKEVSSSMISNWRCGNGMLTVEGSSNCKACAADYKYIYIKWEINFGK